MLNCGVVCYAATMYAAIAALGAEPAAAASTAAAGRRSSSHQQDVKVERAAGIKRERQEGAADDAFVPQSATAAKRVDLTVEVRTKINNNKSYDCLCLARKSKLWPLYVFHSSCQEMQA